MQTRTAAFDQAVREGGIAKTRVDVYDGSVLVLPDVPISEGTIIVDEAAEVRRTLSLTVVDPDLIPASASDPLAPYGNELRVYLGFEYADGTEELLAQGIFRIEEIDPASDGSMVLRGSDRSAVVAAALFEQPYAIVSGTNVRTAVQDLITSRFAGLTYNLATTTETVPLVVFEEGTRSGNPWRNAQQLAAGAGMEVFFDVTGIVVMRPVPDPTTSPVVWEHEPGADSILLGASNRASTMETKNVVVVVGEGTGTTTPRRATAEVTDSSSPILPATFGRRPRFISDPKVTTTAQAQAVADAQLLLEAGASELLGFSAIPHPAHEAGDVVRVEEDVLNLDVRVVLTSFDLPLGLNREVVYQTRARRST